jgi:hypothetical protein
MIIIMKLLRLFLLAVFFVGFVRANAQTQMSDEAKTKLRQNVIKAQANKAKPINSVGSVNNGSYVTNGPVNNINEDDIYMGRKAEFLNNLTVSELPSDFPKYDKSYGLRYYNNLVDNYYGAHKNILQPRVKEKMERMYPSK